MKDQPATAAPSPFDSATQKEKYQAFEWLRGVALGDSEVAHTAAICLVEWHKAFAARSESALLKRLFELMACDTLEEAIMQAELDEKESIAAALAIKKAAGHPENVWPSPHERRFFIALKESLATPSAKATSKWVAGRERNPDLDGRLWAVLTERREQGKRTGFIPTFEYYHFTDGWATDEEILFWLDAPLHPLPSVPHE